MTLGPVEVVDYVELTGSGARETLARVYAGPDGPASVEAIHPNGAAVLAHMVDDQLGPGAWARALAEGVECVRWLSEQYRGGSRMATTRVVTVDTPRDARSLPAFRLAARGQAAAPAERAELVRRCAQTAAALAAGGDSALADDRLARRAYAEALPLVPLARCPFTGEVLFLPVDIGGLDGPYWDYHRPVHPPAPADRPATFLTLGGSMRLERRELERTPFVAVPGPSVPCVAPHLLAHAGVRAVVSARWVGPHAAAAVAYFAEPGATVAHPWLDRWGADGYVVPGEAGVRHAGTPVLDAELRPWITAGKLAWVEPGDGTLTARSTVEDCPYTGLVGSTRLQAVEDGRVLA